jgi:hypothetical protein
MNMEQAQKKDLIAAVQTYADHRDDPRTASLLTEIRNLQVKVEFARATRDRLRDENEDLKQALAERPKDSARAALVSVYEELYSLNVLTPGRSPESIAESIKKMIAAIREDKDDALVQAKQAKQAYAELKAASALPVPEGQAPSALLRDLYRHCFGHDAAERESSSTTAKSVREYVTAIRSDKTLLRKALNETAENLLDLQAAVVVVFRAAYPFGGPSEGRAYTEMAASVVDLIHALRKDFKAAVTKVKAVREALG